MQQRDFDAGLAEVHVQIEQARDESRSRHVDDAYLRRSQELARGVRPHASDAPALDHHVDGLEVPVRIDRPHPPEDERARGHGGGSLARGPLDPNRERG